MGSLEDKTPKEEKASREPPRWRLRLPWLKTEREVGLGDMVRNFTSTIGIRPCPGCESRAAAMNRWMSFAGSEGARAAYAPGGGTPQYGPRGGGMSVPIDLSSASDLICFRARIAVCNAFAYITQFVCDLFKQVTQLVCALLVTLTTVVCDALGLIAQTVCDVMETVSTTVCDAFTTVCDTICDATRWLPWPLDDLICEASHVVCDTVCTVTRVVTQTVCTASHIIYVIGCTLSHIVSSTVCLFSRLVTETVCWIGHFISVVFCILWSIFLALICAIVKFLNWVRCMLKRLGRLVFSVPSRRRKIKHVFVLMLENRSFDHMLGFSGITGQDATTGLPRTIDGLAPNSQSNLNPATGTQEFAAPPADFKLSPADTDPPHEFNYVLTQLCYDEATRVTPPYVAGGAYPPITKKGFVAAYSQTDADAHPSASAAPRKVMDCYGREGRQEQITVLTALAREFAVCDRWFSSLPGPTWPNRFFIHAASSGGLDDSPGPFATATSTLINGYAFENGTIFDRLDAACLEWRIYHGDELPQSFAISGMNLNRALGKLRPFDEFEGDVGEGSYDPVYTFIEPNYGNILPTTPEDFTCGNSQHPLDDVVRGEKLIKKVYEAIRNSPHWNESVLVVTYDEHGGFHDHVTPPAAVQPGDAVSDPENVHHGFTFDRLGVRVPAVVVSPLIPRGIVDHTEYEHTSVLATLERAFRLQPLTNRDRAARDLLHLLSLRSPRADAPTALPAAADSGFTCEDD
jgi:phospholipase C